MFPPVRVEKPQNTREKVEYPESIASVKCQIIPGLQAALLQSKKTGKQASRGPNYFQLNCVSEQRSRIFKGCKYAQHLPKK